MYTIEPVTAGEFNIIDNQQHRAGYVIFLRHKNAKRIMAYPEVFSDPLHALKVLERMQGRR